MRPKIRQEMRKENEKKCLAKLGRGATITQAGVRRGEIREKENGKRQEGESGETGK